MSAFAWVKQAYERPICAEFVQPKRSWKDRRITGAAWSMSRSECFSRRPPTCACSHTHPHSQAHSCHRQAAKDHSQKHPPSRLCFPKYLWHTHTHTHTHSEAACGDSLLSSADSVLWQQQFTHYPAGYWVRALHSEDAGIGFSFLNRNALLSGKSDGPMPRSGSVLGQFKGHTVNFQIELYTSW